MKKNILYLFCLFSLINCSSNKDRSNHSDSIVPDTTKNLLNSKLEFNTIDQLKTTDEVVMFVKDVNPKFAENKHRKFQIKSTDSIAKDLDCGGIFKNWNIKNWEKTDINNDGKTDLLFIAYWYNYMPYAILDLGNNNFRIFDLSNSIFEECELVKPIKIRQKNEILLYHSKSVLDTNLDYKSNPKIDTLTYKFNSFIEINSQKKVDYEIESIAYKTNHSTGFSPVFELKINNQGYANFNGVQYNNFQGISSKPISIELFNELKELLEYIKVKKLENNYEVPWTDDQTAILKIKFIDGSIKEIKDYGLQGSFGLKTVYSKLTKIATETDWK
jgi:hypothetical protein